MRLPPALERYDAPMVRQFVKYGIVGASNTVITFVVYTILVQVVGVEYIVSLILGYLAGSINSYVLNRHWTFRAGHLSHTSVGTRFAIVQVLAILANVGLLYLLVHDAHVHKVAAQAILTLPVLAITFFVNRAWSFAAAS